MEHMSKVVYHVLDKKQGKRGFPNLKSSPLETKGWASTDSWTRGSSSVHGDVRPWSNVCVSTASSRGGFPLSLPWRRRRSWKRRHHDGRSIRNETLAGLWIGSHRSSKVPKRSAESHGCRHHTFPHRSPWDGALARCPARHAAPWFDLDGSDFRTNVVRLSQSLLHRGVSTCLGQA